MRISDGDPIERVRHLFDDQWPGILVDDDDEEEEGGKPTSSIDRADQLRAREFKALLGSQGIDGAFALAKSAKLPGLVAVSWVAALNAVGDVDAVIDRALKEELPLEFFASCSAHTARRFEEPWKDRLFERVKAGTLPLEHGAVMLAGLKESKALWDEIDLLGPEVEAAYWKVINLWFPQVDADGIAMLAEKMLKHGRAASGLMSIRDNTEKLPPDTIFKMLDQSIGELNKLKGPPSSTFVHAVETVFKALSQRKDANIVEIAKLEYRYLPMFGYRDQLFVLGDLLASDPGFYASILFDVFLPASGKKGDVPKDVQRRGEIGYRLLMEFKKLPGTDAKNNVDEKALNKWVDEVLRLCVENDREEIGRVYVGHALARSPDDTEDGAWPHAAVRRIIERLSDKRVEDGIMTEHFNMRGVVTKAMFEGGRQERDLAGRIRGWAKTAASTPRTANMLNRMAENYEHDAKGEDERAEQDRRRF